VVAGLLLLVGAAACALGAVGVWTQREMDEHAVLTTGTVTSVDTAVAYVDVAFEVDGAPEEAEVSWYGTLPGVGERVRIEYDPDDTAYARMPDGTEDRDAGIAFLVGGGAVLLAGGGCAAVALRRRRARRTPAHV
jgi:hypothetical protein